MQPLCTQFIDMCCFITPQIKFGNPASAVMYYKAQMGGREREREERRQLGTQTDTLSWLRVYLSARELDIAGQQVERGAV